MGNIEKENFYCLHSGMSFPLGQPIPSTNCVDNPSKEHVVYIAKEQEKIEVRNIKSLTKKQLEHNLNLIFMLKEKQSKPQRYEQVAILRELEKICITQNNLIKS